MAWRELVWRRYLAEEFNVGVVGAGYVGLVTGACLAQVGHRVVCVDRDEGRVAELKEGQMPIYEPDLEELVAEGSRRGRLSFSTDLPEVVHGADVMFIAVDTPQGDDGAADLSSVGAVA
jgi:UDPglucose 6-dehydrogenase